MGQERDTHADRLGDLARTKRLYDRYAASARKQRAWAADNSGNAAIRAELLARIIDAARGELSGGGRILDAGCGNGWFLAALDRSGIAPERLNGIDLLPARAERAQAQLPAASVRAADARALPFTDASFDLVVMITMLSSMPSRAAVAEALAEARRVISPGGLLLAYEPRLPNVFNSGTRRITRREFESVLGTGVASSSLTVLPQLARRLGRASARVYPMLAAFPLLRSHRLVTWRAGGTG